MRPVNTVFFCARWALPNLLRGTSPLPSPAIISVAAVDQLEEVTDGQLTGIDSGGHGRRLEIAVTSPYSHDHGQAV